MLPLKLSISATPDMGQIYAQNRTCSGDRNTTKLDKYYEECKMDSLETCDPRAPRPEAQSEPITVPRSDV